MLLTQMFGRPLAVAASLLMYTGAFAQQPPGRSFPLPFSPDLPYDVNRAVVDRLDQQGRVLEAQREFDILSWQAFIALNWPAAADGSPARDKTIADSTANRVW